jgi:hypothetical protein
VKNPQITSHYSSFGPSEGNEFGSTSYTNYPSTTTIIENHKPQIINSAYSALINHDSNLPSNFFTSSNVGSNPSLPSLSSIPSSNLPDLTSIYKSLLSKPHEQEVISQHVEVNQVSAVPVFKKFPYPVAKHFPVAIPHPVLVPYPQLYPVNVMISEPVAVPIIKEIKVMQFFINLP